MMATLTFLELKKTSIRQTASRDLTILRGKTKSARVQPRSSKSNLRLFRAPSDPRSAEVGGNHIDEFDRNLTRTEPPWRSYLPAVTVVHCNQKPWWQQDFRPFYALPHLAAKQTWIHR